MLIVHYNLSTSILELSNLPAFNLSDGSEESTVLLVISTQVFNEIPTFVFIDFLK